MGRPINKRYLKTPTLDGNEIKVNFHNGTAVVNGWIMSQRGSKTFRCTDGTNEAICQLVDKESASLLANEMNILVKDDAGVVKRAVKISGRKVTTSTGESIKWNFSDATDDNAVEIEEAGIDETLADADEFVEPVEP